MLNPSRRNAAVAAAILAVGIGGTTSAMLANGHLLPAQPVQSLNASHSLTLPDDWHTADLPDADVSYLDSQLLPYYRVDAPAWCSEVMACWTGSNADTRTDRQVLAAIRCDIARGSYSGVATNLTDAQSAAYMAGLDTICGGSK